MGGPNSVNLPMSVAPGQTVDLTINLTAPNAGGSYRGYWKFKDANGVPFGIGADGTKSWWVDIRVSGATATPGTAPTATPGTPYPTATPMTMVPTTTPATSATATNNSTGSVVISNFSFQPPNLQVKVGTSVTWMNNDTTQHTVTSDTSAFDSGVLAPGAMFSFTFNQTGTFNYHCNIHTFMKGTITVVP
jgi:plastocyanin